MSNRLIAVTGATGHLGRRVVTRLLERDQAVVAVVRDAERAADLAAAGAQVRVAAYGDEPALSAAFAGVDTVVLISGSEVGQRAAQHASVVHAARDAGVERVVYTSAPRATDTDLVLAPEHAATEALLHDSGLAVTIVRNNWYIENYAQTVETARAAGVVVSAAGQGRVPSATRDDYADALVAVALDPAHAGQTYELAGDEAWTMAEFTETLSELIGREVALKLVSPDQLTDILIGHGLDAGTAGFVAALDANIAAGALEVPDRTLRDLIGRPTPSLADQLRTLL